MDSTGGNEPAHAGFEPSNFPRSFFGTARAVILQPARFFRDLDRRGPSSGAVLFAVVCIVINFVLLFAAAPVDSWILGTRAYPGPNVVYGVILALSPLLAWIGLYAFAAIQHLFVTIFVRPRKTFYETLEAYAYASALALLSWVPVVGYLASAYGLYVTMLGIRELHETSTTRAFLAVLVPLLVFLASIAWSVWPLPGS